MATGLHTSYRCEKCHNVLAYYFQKGMYSAIVTSVMNPMHALRCRVERYSGTPVQYQMELVALMQYWYRMHAPQHYTVALLS
jgi:hypothetical protein